MSAIPIQIHGDGEVWQGDADRYCLHCGVKGVWLLASEGTYYENDMGLCIACDSMWIWDWRQAETWAKERALLIRKTLRTKGTVQA